jgi:hypothetical protein
MLSRESIALCGVLVWSTTALATPQLEERRATPWDGGYAVSTIAPSMGVPAVDPALVYGAASKATRASGIDPVPTPGSVSLMAMAGVMAVGRRKR